MICPNCGNNDVTDPEVCPKCHTVLKVNNEKIGAKSQWKTNNYVIKKEKDVNTRNAAIVLVVVIILIGVIVGLSIHFDLLSGKKKIVLKDALIYINNINSYITASNVTTDKDGNKIIPKYKVNKVEYDFVKIPSSKKCIFKDGKWDSEDCKIFIEDIKQYCKDNGKGCVIDPTNAIITIENNRVKNGSTVTFDNLECVYELKDTKNTLSDKNIKCSTK